MSGAWGSGSWGSGSWGGGLGLEIAFVAALAVRENVVRVEFSQRVFFTGLLEIADASRPSAWGISAVAGTFGMSGDEARPARVASVHLSGEEDGVSPADFGRFVDLVLDRPMTSWPATYVVSWTNVYQDPIGAPISGSAAIEATYRIIEAPRIDVPRTARDFANPQTGSAAREALPNPGSPLSLGTFGVDSSGDYAADEGIASLKKRVIRRLITRRGAFAHLPNYGVGVPDRLKRLGTNAELSSLRAEAESQISLEPDVAAVRVSIVISADVPNLVRLRVAVRPKVGNPVAFEVPFDRSTGTALAA